MLPVYQLTHLPDHQLYALPVNLPTSSYRLSKLLFCICTSRLKPLYEPRHTCHLYVYMYPIRCTTSHHRASKRCLEPGSQRLSFLSVGAKNLNFEVPGALVWHPRGPLGLHFGTLGDHLGTFWRRGRILISFLEKG